jgi:ubiquinone/menaquinone biosynthesis C-methylase UbiE
MNYKLLFPTYRSRYNFIKRHLDRYAGVEPFSNGLNLGAGEGDYDPLLASKCKHLTACDINERDVAFASSLNATISNIEYRVENALNLSFPDNSFDFLVSVEVIEHVGDPPQMIREIERVLKHGGYVFMTFPQIHFPITYDPVNYLFGRKVIAQGIYAFGHDYLIDPDLFKKQVEDSNLEIVEEYGWGGYLIGLLEMYWTGLMQSIFKDNASNLNIKKSGAGKLRPTAQEPFLVRITDIIIWLDHHFFKSRKHTIGKGFVLRKNSHDKP